MNDCCSGFRSVLEKITARHSTDTVLHRLRGGQGSRGLQLGTFLDSFLDCIVHSLENAEQEPGINIALLYTTSHLATITSSEIHISPQGNAKLQQRQTQKRS